MLDKYNADIDNFFSWYVEVKSILTSAEIAELNGKIYFQPYNELRYALDHFMRAIGWSKEQAAVAEDKKVELDKNIKSALKSATGHLQRAYSDVLEWYFLTVKNMCVKTLTPYESEQIIHAIPNYYSEIKPFLMQFEKNLAFYKENKSSEKNDLTSEENADFILFNSDDFNKLGKIFETVQKSEASLMEMRSKGKKKNIITAVIIPVITCIVGTVVGGIITAFIMG